MENNFRLTYSRYLKINLLLLILSIVGMTIALIVGTVEISFYDVLAVLTGKSDNEIHKTIILELRLPRILLAFAVGGGLSVSGAIFQALLMNPLAEPYILGISGGASFGAVLSFILGLSFIFTQFFSLTGALLVIFLVYIIGKRFGEIEPNILLLSGVIVGAFFSAMILISLSFLDNSIRNALFWIIGNLSLASKESLKFILPISFLTVIYFTLNSNKFNLISLGKETAEHLGVTGSVFIKISYFTACLLVGSVVSVSGIIGFVGLIIPHISRLIFGNDYRIVIPSSFFLGAFFLIIADLFARTIMAPQEMPVGAVTAILGAPMFIYLLRKYRFS